MSLFATHTAWFDTSVPKQVVTQFTANGGHVTKSATSPHTQLLFSLTPPSQPPPSSPSPPLFFHPQWVSASVAAGALQPLSSHLLPPATYKESANAVELHLQVASRMGEEWRKGQQERLKGRKKARGGRQQKKKARVLQDDEVDEVVEVEPPKPRQSRGARRVAALESTEAVDTSEVQAEEQPKAKRSKRKQPASKRVATAGRENGDLSYQRWPEMPRRLNGREAAADDDDEHEVLTSRVHTRRSLQQVQQLKKEDDEQRVSPRKRRGVAADTAPQVDFSVDVSAFGAFSSWFADPFVQQPPARPQPRLPQHAGRKEQVKIEDEEIEEDQASEDEWEVEAVVDKRTNRQGQVEYRLKWSRADGRPVAQDDEFAWVKASDCHCNELIDKFERQHSTQGETEVKTDHATQQQRSRTVNRRTTRASRSKREAEDDEEVEDVEFVAAHSFGGWMVEPNFDSIIAELQHSNEAAHSSRPPHQATGKGNRAREAHRDERGVKEEKQEEAEEQPQPLHRSRARASASRSPARPVRSAADKSRQAISHILADFDHSLDIDTPHAYNNTEAAADDDDDDDEVQEVEVHEETVEGRGDARTLTVRHTVLRRSPARLTSLMPFPATTSGRQLFFPRGRSPARVELYEDHKHQTEDEDT